MATGDRTPAALEADLQALRDNLRVVHGLSMRWFRETFHTPTGAVVLLVVRPVAWYLLFGGVFQQVAELPMFPSESYRAFIVPGILAFLCIEFFAIGGQCVVADLESGFLQKLWAAPINKSAVIVARIFVMAVLNVVQVSILVGFAIADGLTVVTGVPGLALVYAMTILLTIGVTAISMIIAYTVEYEFTFTMITSFLFLPALFISNAFMPTDLMADWLAVPAALNPVSLMITAMRTLLIRGWVMEDVLPGLVLLVGVAVVSTVVAAYWFDRAIEREGGVGPAIKPGCGYESET